MSKRFIATLLTLLVIIAGAGLAIMLAKGYTFSSTQKQLVGTGIIAVSSTPDGALVYLDGHLINATDTTLSQLTPKKYTVKISKDGYIPWEKEVEVKAGLATEIKATLFPALPTIYPLTYNGVVSAVLSPDGQKLAFSVPLDKDSQLQQKGGIWVWSLVSQPISFARGAQPRQILTSASGLDFSQASLRWSPDSKQLLVSLPESSPGAGDEHNYLLAPDQATDLSNLRDITPSLNATLQSWADDQKQKDAALISTIRDAAIQNTASSSANIRWSPDETKFIDGIAVNEQSTSIGSGPTPTPAKTTITPTPQLLQGVKVYDLETSKSFELPPALDYIWLPDSLHIILVEPGKVSICEYDGSNVAVIFGSQFAENAVFPWPDSSRLVILTSFSTPTASVPNLFGINLK